MSPTTAQPEKNRAQSAYNLTLATVAGLVGCLTLFIVVAALFGGLWLDRAFATKPMFTIGLMIASIPVTLIMMFWVVKAVTSRLQPNSKQDNQSKQEETNGGK